jgi:hypothetical protein
MLALFIGLIAYVFVSRSSTLVGALLAIVPPTVVVLLVAYDADLLATTNPTSNAAVAQGKDVALAVAGAALAAALLRFLTLMIDRGLENRKRLRWTRRKARIVLAAGLVAVVLVAVAAGAPSWISNQYHAFVSGSPISTTDLRSRLTNPSSNGRTEHWRAAIKGFDASPIHGSGAGTYQFLWERNRRVTFPVIDAHSLYVEVLGELGVPGLLLILATIVTILATLRHRIRGPNRMVYAALFAAVLTWAIHAGVDWDWEMPAVTAWVFAVGGAALAGRASGRPATPMGDRGRIPIAAALLVVAVTPALLMLSQYRLQTAATAFDRGSCKPAKREAIASINILAVRPQPYQIVGYCDLDDGRVQEAVTAMQKAVEQEPKSWEYHYGLAIAQGFAGIDPRPELAVATGLNPKEDLLNQANKAFAQTGNSSTAWFKAAQQLNDATRVSGRLTLR